MSATGFDCMSKNKETELDETATVTDNFIQKVNAITDNEWGPLKELYSNPDNTKNIHMALA